MVHIYFASLERSPSDGGRGEGGGAGRQDPKLEALQEFLALLRDANAGGRWFLNIHRETIVDSVLAQFSGQAGAGSLGPASSEPLRLAPMLATGSGWLGVSTAQRSRSR